MRFSRLSEWLQWLETLHPTEMELGLGRINAVAQRMGLTRPAPQVVSIAGTNGKGSCVAALESILKVTGARTGTYTSPHLLHYCERIKINGCTVDEQSLCEAFQVIDDARGGVSLTYFEFGTLAALHIFEQSVLDLVILEVGLGGRLDAVNIVDADIAVITSIDLDHQEWLGETREAIGKEKAGILRPDQFFVCADRRPPKSVLDAAVANNSRSLFIGEQFDFQLQELDSSGLNKQWHWRGTNGRGKPVSLNGMALPGLPWPSVAAAVQTAYLLKGDISDKAVRKGLDCAELPGRFQCINSCGIDIVLDVAHNPAAAEHLAVRLCEQPFESASQLISAASSAGNCAGDRTGNSARNSEWDRLLGHSGEDTGQETSHNALQEVVRQSVGKTVVVFSMLKDKDIAAVIEIVSRMLPIAGWYIAPLTGVARAATSEQMSQALSSVLKGRAAAAVQQCFAGVEQAFVAAKSDCQPGDRIVVFGSFYTVAQILARPGLWDSAEDQDDTKNCKDVQIRGYIAGE